MEVEQRVQHYRRQGFSQEESLALTLSEMCSTGATKPIPKPKPKRRREPPRFRASSPSPDAKRRKLRRDQEEAFLQSVRRDNVSRSPNPQPLPKMEPPPICRKPQARKEKANFLAKMFENLFSSHDTS